MSMVVRMPMVFRMSVVLRMSLMVNYLSLGGELCLGGDALFASLFSINHHTITSIFLTHNMFGVECILLTSLRRTYKSFSGVYFPHHALQAATFAKSPWWCASHLRPRSAPSKHECRNK